MAKISVIIPVYNRKGCVAESIKSVLAQTHGDIELIVVDDGSTDGTKNTIKAIHDERLSYYFKENGGTSSARNFGLIRAAGDYIAFLDHDDLWPENYLETMIGELDKNPEYGLAYSALTRIEADGRKTKSYKRPKGKSGWLYCDLFRTGFVWTSAAVMRREALDGFGYDESLKTSYEDGDFFLRLSLRTKFLFVDKVEAIRCEHSDNLSVKVGVRPTRILVLERFLRCGGWEKIPKIVASKRLGNACRKVAKSNLETGKRTAAIQLYRKAISYKPWDIRLYLELMRAFFLKKEKDAEPDWQMPQSLQEIG
ncbi:MAG: glycosyltransferase family 2 protein [Phycisphaerae bacterium]|nr:glycosyltransferase family 2 protein [Phycisphaerae bacterium]